MAASSSSDREGGALSPADLAGRPLVFRDATVLTMDDSHRVIRPLLKIPENEIIICGMALGHIDPDAPVNALITERAPVSDFATFDGL